MTISSLCNHRSFVADEICTELNSLNVKTILTDAKKKFTQNEVNFYSVSFAEIFLSPIIIVYENFIVSFSYFVQELITSVLNTLTRLGGGQHVGKRTGSARSRPRTPLRK